MNKDLQIAKKTVQTEIQALKKLSTSFGESSYFSKAVKVYCCRLPLKHPFDPKPNEIF